MKLNPLSFLAPLLLSLSISTLAASPAWMSNINAFPGKPGPNKTIKPLALDYALSWNGALNAGQMTFIYNKKDPQYKRYFLSQSFGKSTGIGRTIFPYDFNFVSLMNKKSLKPITFMATENDKKEITVTDCRYRSSGVTVKQNVTLLKHQKKTSKKKTFNYPHSFDLMSAIMHVRSLDLKKGQQIKMVVHPFRSPYLCQVTVLGKEKHRKQECIKLDVKLRKIGSDLKLKTYKKMKNATLWLSDDVDRIPVELRAKVFIGNVRAELQRKRNL